MSWFLAWSSHWRICKRALKSGCFSKRRASEEDMGPPWLIKVPWLARLNLSWYEGSLEWSKSKSNLFYTLHYSKSPYYVQKFIFKKKEGKKSYLKTRYRLALTWPLTKSVTDLGNPSFWRNSSPTFSWVFVPKLLPPKAVIDSNPFSNPIWKTRLVPLF